MVDNFDICLPTNLRNASQTVKGQYYYVWNPIQFAVYS